MAFNEKELEIIRAGREAGRSRSEIEDALLNFRTNKTPSAGLPEEQRPSLMSRGRSVGVGAAKGLAEGAIGTARILQRGGQEALGLIPGVDRQEVLDETGFPQLGGEQARAIDEQLRAENREEMAGKILGFGAELGAGFAPAIGRGIARGAGRVGQALSGLGQGVRQLGEQVADNPLVRGTIQTGQEIAERIPRFVGRVREGTEEAALRAQRIRESAPAVREAISSGIDDRFINTALTADQPTIKGYKQMIDIAEDTGTGTLRPKEQPTIVAGRAVEDQFELIEKQRKNVGQRIEQAVDNLPNAKVQMQPSINQLESVLQQNGLVVRNGVVEPGTSTLSKAQIDKIQELYQTALRASGEVDAKRVHGMDRLFSQLQREARFDQLDNIFLNVNGEDVNAFRMFRDVFRNQLDNLSPEIRELNREYATIRGFMDRAEASIFKTPSFEPIKATDPAEFAKVNLRRLAGEAQSTPAYQSVVNDMDTLARELGYDGARADDLIFFAQELRKLYPETTPPTGFQGSFRAGVSDIAERVLRAGEADVIDQRRALRNLINSLVEETQ